jgi:hypothetical protein
VRSRCLGSGAHEVAASRSGPSTVSSQSPAHRVKPSTRMWTGVPASALQLTVSPCSGLGYTWQLLAPAVMTVLCLVASVLALQRVRRLEPGMVFR